MRPKILFVDHTAILGGGELSLFDIACHFKNTCRVILLSDGPFREALEKAGVQVEVLASALSVHHVSREGGLLQDLKALPGVLAAARSLARHSRSFDLIYANSQKSAIVAGLAGRLSRKPVIWHLRDLMIDQHFSKLHRKLTVRATRVFVRRVLANSEATRRAFVDNGARPGMVHVVYNGIDVMRFRFTDEDALSIRNSLGLNGVPVVGVFSRLARWKGQHILLEALPALPKVHAVFVGEAIFPRDKTYLGELLKTVARLRLEDRVHFLGFREDVPRLLRMCDVVAHTSTAPEPFGRVIVEGMLAGRPVIATRGGGATEIIEHRRTGLLVNPGDVPALVEAISWSLAAREQANEMARRGREAAQQRFSLEAMMGNVEYHIGEVTRDVKRIPLRLS